MVGTSEMSHLYMLDNPCSLLSSQLYPATTRELCNFVRFKNGEIDAKSRVRKEGGGVCSGFKHTATEFVSLNALCTKNPEGWHMHGVRVYIL